MGNVLSWRNTGETSRFPFREDATLLSTTQRSIPEGFLVDAQVFAPNDLEGVPFLKTVRVVGSKILGAVAINDTIIGSFSIASSDVNNGVVALQSDEGFARGTLVFGALAIDAFQTLKIGDNAFTVESAGFEASCVFRYPSNVVNSITVLGVPYSGKIALVEGDGVAIVKTSQSDLRFDATGSPTEIQDCCVDPGESVKSINGAVPNSHGNIQFNVETFSEPETPSDDRQVLRLNSIPNGIRFDLAI